MSVKMKKPTMELVDCAEALRKLSLSTPVNVMEELIADGLYHLEELQTSPICNPLLVTSLAARLDRAEAILEQKRKHEAVEW